MSLHSLKYSVTFKVPNKTLKGDITFQKGLSGISGPNEAGKSTVLEMIRFGLWGSKALRTSLSAYEKLNIDLSFALHGKDHRVTRTGTSAQLFEDDKMIASGTSHVNEKIEKLFGYGMNVFDIAHFCQQGDVEALTAMKPLDRKKMIDRVVGMDNLDAASASVLAEASSLRSTIKGMELGLGPRPQEPTRPAGWQALTTVQAEISRLKPLAQEVGNIKAWLAARGGLTAPVPPEEPTVTYLEGLRKQEALRQDLLKLQESLRQKVAGYSYPRFNALELDEFQHALDVEAAVQAKAQFEAKYGPEPVEDPVTLGLLLEHWDDYDASQGALECPKCHHSWHPDNGEACAPVEKPSLTRAEIREKMESKRAWQRRTRHPLEDAPVGTASPLTQREIEVGRTAWALMPVFKQLKDLVIPDSVADQILEVESYQRALADYEAKEKEWLAFQEEQTAKQNRLAEIEPDCDKLSQWEALLPAVLQHQALMEAYTTALVDWDMKKADLEDLKKDLEQAVAAGDAVKLLRTKIKAYLVPSLNVAASQLISLMTGGQRQDIAVDENFETILVDGQPVETLSGSGKAVANLAIRLGLGQVLTNKVFSVFLGDEIDASMDADRANNTAECLKGLTSVIDQIILVSHKDLDVQHNIKIG